VCDQLGFECSKEFLTRVSIIRSVAILDELQSLLEILHVSAVPGCEFSLNIRAGEVSPVSTHKQFGFFLDTLFEIGMIAE
jgi:hypothetical protein